MPKLPNGERAFVDPAKLTGYVLNPAHDAGGNKAHVFLVSLGLTAANSDLLQRALLRAAKEEEAALTHSDIHGNHFAVEFTMRHGDRQRRLRSRWTVRHHEDFPRLVSVWVKKGQADV